MELFIDSGSIKEIEEAASWGILSGVTTNPSLLAKEEGDLTELIKKVCVTVQGPVSVEVVAPEAREMVRQGKALSQIHRYVVVKVPFSDQGLKACYELCQEDIKVNMTLVFSAAQAILAAEAGAEYVSVFMGRVDDAGGDSAEGLLAVVESLRDSKPKTLAASIRRPEHAIAAARMGCPVATIPYKTLQAMLHHDLTEQGLEKFNRDWESKPELQAWMDRTVNG